MHDHDDFDFEDSPGIPAPLPAGEHVVWQGSPDVWEIAKNAFHIRKIAVYFGLILLIQAVSIYQMGADSAGASLSMTTMLSILGLGILGVLAYLTSRVTIYTITNKRILIRFGIALQMTVNLPFSQISAADVRVGKNGSGDIPLTMKDSKRISYLVMWPHVRPWNFSRPQPMIRSVANVQKVARIIADIASESPVAIDSVASNAASSVTRAAPTRRTMSGATADSVLMNSESS
ncbi:MAG: photosynthetic complex putative assembly protein PuhB [Granulosicoccus sp.]